MEQCIHAKMRELHVFFEYNYEYISPKYTFVLYQPVYN